MATVPTLPGLYYEQVAAPAEPSPLRSDVAGFVGRTRRGETNRAVRVEGWREYLEHFGGLDEAAPMTYSLRGYFENGGEVAWVARVLGRDKGELETDWKVADKFDSRDSCPTSYPYTRTTLTPEDATYRIAATSAGSWAGGLTVQISYSTLEASSPGVLFFVVRAKNEPAERFQISLRSEEGSFLFSTPSAAVENDLNAGRVPESLKTAHADSGHPLSGNASVSAIEIGQEWQLDDDNARYVVRKAGAALNVFRGTTEEDEKRAFERAVSNRSKLIRIDVSAARSPQHLLCGGPRTFSWPDLILGTEKPASAKATIEEQYTNAIQTLCDQPEVAILALPGLCDDFDLPAPSPGFDQWMGSPHLGILKEAITKASELQDRLVIADVPASEADARSASDFARALRERIPSSTIQRAAAVYHPWLRVDDPLGGNIAPLRTIPPSGHIAGVISREDRGRGAHHTPANVPIDGAVDLETSFDDVTGGHLTSAHVNLIRCVPGRGLAVWGGRTLSRERDGRFIGHRRFIHRLVRAIRRVTEPLVFETNGPEQWLIIVRAISSVLLEAFRTNALQGSRPEEAFRVRCDARTNPPEEREQGRMLCEIDVALAVPMEFITLRVAVSQTGQVEVFDS